ncbi:lysophospholipid acyltransferase family protein [Marinicella sp. W31]|uniref:lysophospholipid acyltransferase family protein n=1 Tax=Marinicella sp. W31 TaxID=3023713 RepID=UPI00375817A5
MLFFLLSIVFILPIVVVGILLSKLFKLASLNALFLTSWSHLMCLISGITIHVHGRIEKAPVFIVANHVSWLDIPIIHSLALAGFVAKSEIRRWPLLGWLSLAGDTLFLQRGSHHSRNSVIDTIKKRLLSGRSVAVFPEGTVTDGSHLRHFHRQLLVAAIETQTPIQPVAIKFIRNDGTRNQDMAFINNEGFVRHVWRILTLPSSTVEVYCGEPITDFESGARAVTQSSRDYIEKELKNNGYLQTAHQT